MLPSSDRAVAADGYETWVGHFVLSPGMEAAWAELSVEMVVKSRAEAGTIAYHHHLNSDGTVLAYERYADSAAALSHLDHFGAQFATRMQTIVAHRRVFLVRVSRQVRIRISGLGAEVVGETRKGR